MNLLEYEAKSLLRQHAVPVPDGVVVQSVDEAVPAAFPAVLKVQIPKGGRGKAGGIKVVNDQMECSRMAGDLLGSMILDCKVQTLWLESALDYERELYVSIVLDRSAMVLVLLAHRSGGVEIEQAANEADPLLRVPLEGEPDAAVVDRLQEYWRLPAAAVTQLPGLLRGLYETCVQEDALLLEINPLMLLKDGRLVCADAKVELDDAAVFRHAGWNTLETRPASAQFVELDAQGTVASMANGAGLAMATVDAIKTAGAEPANFFDVGGGTNVEGMVQAFQKIAAMPRVRSIVVNIFGGITRCDEVAEAIVEAQKRCPDLPELFIRLTGTNEAEGRAILEAADMPLYPTLAACVAEAVKA